MSGNAPTVPFVQSGSSNVPASRPDTQRDFELPRIEELSKEQEDARALPKHGQHLIIGGPGTGKSVLALIRSRRHHLDKDDYVFLVYNKLLNQSGAGFSGRHYLPHCLRPTRRAECFHGARCDAARRRAHPSALRRPSGFEPARMRACAAMPTSASG